MLSLEHGLNQVISRHCSKTKMWLDIGEYVVDETWQNMYILESSIQTEIYLLGRQAFTFPTGGSFRSQGKGCCLELYTLKF